MTTSSPQATIAAASNAKLTPAAPGWAEVEGSRVLEDLFVDIAKGGDVAELAAAADEKITEQLNELTPAPSPHSRPGRRRRQSTPPRPRHARRSGSRPRTSHVREE